MEYSEYRHFIPPISRAKEACRNSGQQIVDHFEDILEMVKIGSGASRKVEDIKLSRYACYLIVQNADPSKEVLVSSRVHGRRYPGRVCVIVQFVQLLCNSKSLLAVFLEQS